MENDKNLRPKVGIGVLVFKDDKVLMGKRKSSHGTGEYAGTGGHLEHVESFEQCAKRETLEEAGIQIENVRFLCLVNVKDYAPKHDVDIGLIAAWKAGQPKVMEPEKLENWNWYTIDNLPSPLFGMIPKYIESYKNNQKFWDN